MEWRDIIKIGDVDEHFKTLTDKHGMAIIIAYHSEDCGLELSTVGPMIVTILFQCLGHHLNARRRNPLPIQWLMYLQSYQSFHISQANQSSIAISPGKSVDLRMKNLQQLRFIQQLFDDNILSQDEFLEQKKSILEALRKL